jgi:hypothetical protein
MCDIEVIDELRLLSAVRRTAQELSGRTPNTATIEELLDKRAAAGNASIRGICPERKVTQHGSPREARLPRNSARQRPGRRYQASARAVERPGPRRRGAGRPDMKDNPYFRD